MTRSSRVVLHTSSGLTLLELVVVLAILSALGTVMVVQTTSLTDEARFQQTVRTLDQLRDAVIGRQPIGAEDPTGLPPGFVSDMGRLPTSGAGSALEELWDASLFEANPPLVPDDLFFKPRTIEWFDSQLEMLSGWRGPYVRLPVGASDLRDGWGRSFRPFDRFDAETLGAEIGTVRSDGPGPGNPFEPAEPLGVVFERVIVDAVTLEETTVTDRVMSRLPLDGVRVRFERGSGAAGGYGVVRLYGVADGVPTLLAQSDVFPESGRAPEDDTTIVPVVFSDVPTGTLLTVRGPKILVAYELDIPIDPVPPPPPAPPTDAGNPDADLGALRKGILRFTLPAGGLTSIPSLILSGE